MVQILVAQPRGFCAGVVRAVKIVELALDKYGVPVYVKHPVVHNPFVVDRLEQIAQGGNSNPRRPQPNPKPWSR